jgi:hypothetical protein
MVTNYIKSAMDLPGLRAVDSLLSLEQRRNDLHLYQDEDFVYLFKGGTKVATWYNGPTLTLTGIHEEADKWLPGRDAVAELIDCGGVSFG